MAREEDDMEGVMISQNNFGMLLLGGALLTAIIWAAVQVGPVALDRWFG